MAITYEWDVSQVETYPIVDNNVDVIHKIFWLLKAVDDVNNDSEGMPLTMYHNGSVTIDTSDLSSFVAFDDITTADVQGWVDASLGSDLIAELLSTLATRLEKTITPTSVLKTIGGS
tara:strand:+ start:313 stop:663 length:351 start_codon:yes stop_codon:yes gene_type:complete